MGNKSRDRGIRGELEACRKLNAWWMQDDKYLKEKIEGMPIRRTPGSGGWAKGRGVGGDLVAVHEVAYDFNKYFSVEVKNAEGWDFGTMLKPDKKSWAIDVYWSQCKNDAKHSNAYPFLLFTKNYHPWYFKISSSFWKCVKNAHGMKKDPFPVVRYASGIYGLADNFFSSFTPENVKKIPCL